MISSTQERYFHSEERQEGDELGILANDLRQAICNAMDEQRTTAEMLPFFAKHAVSEKVSFADFTAWKKGLRRDQYADELVLALTAKELGLRIAVIPSCNEWLIRWHPRDEGAGMNESVIYLGNDDRHYVCLKVEPIVDRSLGSVVSEKGQGAEEARAMSMHGSGCKGMVQSRSTQDTIVKPREVEAGLKRRIDVIASSSEEQEEEDEKEEEEAEEQEKPDAKPKPRHGCDDETARSGGSKRTLEEARGPESSDATATGSTRGVQEVEPMPKFLRRLPVQAKQSAAGMQLQTSSVTLPDRWASLQDEFRRHWITADLNSVFRKTSDGRRDQAYYWLQAAVQKANLKAFDDAVDASLILKEAVEDVLVNCT